VGYGLAAPSAGPLLRAARGGPGPAVALNASLDEHVLAAGRLVSKILTQRQTPDASFFEE
jgi:hypothetical protein